MISIIFLAVIYSFKFLFIYYILILPVLSGMRLLHSLMSLLLIPRSLSAQPRERLTSGGDEAEFLLYNNQINYGVLVIALYLHSVHMHLPGAI